MQKIAFAIPINGTFGVSMERGPELSAVLWTVLILCIILIVYLSFVPEDRQQKDKEAADAFTATVIPSFKKKPDDKKET
jgi:bacteriorhodopsin